MNNSLIPKRSMSVYARSSNRRPRTKLYHREPGLDKAMDLRKKPNLLLKLRSIIVSSGTKSVLLRELEREVGFVEKWRFVDLVRRYGSVFRVGGGTGGRGVSVRLTDKAEMVSNEEFEVRKLMEPILVKKLKKLLMMSMDCQIPLEKVDLIQSDLGLEQNYKNTLIPKYPEFFSVKKIKNSDYLCLENWDSSIAITSREENLNFENDENAPFTNPKIIPRDGNIMGPFSFKLKFPAEFRPNKTYLEQIVKWQNMPFNSPYLNSRLVGLASPEARKRAVSVLHEILSLTKEKMLTSNKLDAFHNEYQLPCRLLLCLVKNHGVFYITNKGARSTVFLKEGYEGSQLVEKCPLMMWQDRFVALIGRSSLDVCQNERILV